MSVDFKQGLEGLMTQQNYSFLKLRETDWQTEVEK